MIRSVCVCVIVEEIRSVCVIVEEIRSVCVLVEEIRSVCVCDSIMMVVYTVQVRCGLLFIYIFINLSL